MPKVLKECRICGKQYEGCYTPVVDGVFRWQEVACSPEHGAIYLQRVLESRGQAPAPEAKATESESVVCDTADGCVEKRKKKSSSAKS